MFSCHSPEALPRCVFDALDRLAGDTRIVGVAVSGGSDSAALVHLTSAWALARGKSARAFCLDHGLRRESAGEARTAARLAAAVGMGCEVERLRDRAGTSSAAARRLRHQALARWAHRLGIGVLALGHTADDRLETLLMRERSTRDPFGLAAPTPCGPSPVWPAGRGLRLVRPLLDIPRRSLKAWLTGQGIGWCADPSNFCRRSTRVRVRRELATAAPERLLAESARADRLLERRRAITLDLRRLFADATVWFADGSALLACREHQIDEDIAVRGLQWLAMAVSGSPTPPRLRKCRAGLERLRTERAATTLGGAWIARRGEWLGFARAPEGASRTRRAPVPDGLRFDGGDEAVWDGRFAVRGAKPSLILTSFDTVRRHARPGRDVRNKRAAELSGSGGAPAWLAGMARRSRPVPADWGTPHATAVSLRALHRDRVLALATDPGKVR